DEAVRDGGASAQAVGVGDVEPLLDQSLGQVAPAGPMASPAEGLVDGLAPDVLSARREVDVEMGPCDQLIEDEDVEGRNALLGELLVLIVAPDQDEVGAESVDATPHHPKGVH